MAARAQTMLIHDGHILMVQMRKPDGSNFWCFPGGAVERGETPAQAAVREMCEETGLNVHITDLLWIEIATQGPYDMYHTFLAEWIGGNVIVGTDPEPTNAVRHQIIDVRWRPLVQTEDFSAIDLTHFKRYEERYGVALLAADE